jgi:hypothetical protein
MSHDKKEIEGIYRNIRTKVTLPRVYSLDPNIRRRKTKQVIFDISLIETKVIKKPLSDISSYHSINSLSDNDIDDLNNTIINKTSYIEYSKFKIKFY